MINPIEFQELKEDLSQFNQDWDIMLQMLMLLEVKKLNYNLSQIDFDLREMVRK